MTPTKTTTTKKPATRPKRTTRKDDDVDLATARREVLERLQKRLTPEQMKVAEITFDAVAEYVDDVCSGDRCLNWW